MVLIHKWDIHCGRIVCSGDHIKRLHDRPCTPSSRSDTVYYGVFEVTWSMQLEHARLVLDMPKVKGIMSL